MPEYTQANLPMRIDTVLDEDVLLLNSFSGTEAISKPFTIHLDLLSEDPEIDPDELLRSEVLLSIDLPDGSTRPFHGHISQFVQLGRSDELTHYQAEMVPWLWFLSLSQDCRIFQEMDVLEIVEEIFSDLGYSDFDVRCVRNYPKRQYCVQYRESHLNFISRLLEEEGIFYFFEHSDSGHVMVIADDNSSIQPSPGAEEVRIMEDASPGEDVVHSLRRKHAVHLGRVTLRDYDYLKPSLQLESSVSGEEWEEAYDYPGKYSELEDGDRYSRLRLEESEMGRQMVRGRGACRGFQSGFRFDLAGHYRADANTTYALVEIRHDGSAGGYRSDAGPATHYSNEFLAIPHEVPFRPPHRAERPRIQGTQTAEVVGPSGEEIWVDEHSRIKVQFHWDRRGEKDENSSCWIRVASTWAGKSWGAIEIPRIGQEVLVDFLEGDPDRPIVVGSVYNAEQTPPWGLPDSGTVSGVKSRSSKGGGGYNEISLEDRKDEEMINVHAQKDMTTTVLNDQTDSVGNDRSRTVGNDETVAVEADQSVEVGANQSTAVGGNRSVSVDGSQETEVGGSRSTEVGAEDEVQIGANRKCTVGGNLETTVGANEDSTVGANLSTTVGVAAKLEAGATIDLTANAGITLTVGGSFIRIGPDGVTISGPNVTVLGSAMVNVTGALVKIN